MPALVAGNLSELDSLLADLNKARYTDQVNNEDMVRITEQVNKKDKLRYTEQDMTCGYQRFYNGIRGQDTNRQELKERPSPTKFKDAFALFPAPSVDSQLNGNRKDHHTLTNVLTREQDILANVLTVNRTDKNTLSNALKVNRKEQDTLTNVNRKEQETLGNVNRKKQDALANVLTDFDKAEREPTGGRDDYADYDYSSKWDYLGKGIWENQDYGSTSNYSTLRTSQDEYDYTSLDRDTLPLSEEELEKSTGAGPRGDRSKVIETDHGEVQSKYRYMGFGLWENTDPTEPKKRKKLRPPPPPPKAQPIIYNCTVSVTKSASTKELDDLKMKDRGSGLVNRVVELATGVGDLRVRDPFERFEKEDMSDMFKRAMLEKMQLVDSPRAKYRCFVCSKMIQGRIITAMGNKFHPQCFVCTYCRKEFKDRKYKTDPRDCKPYCFGCFEKLLGHYGSAHQG